MDAREVQGVGLGRAASRQFDVLFPTPKERLLEMIAPTRFTATLEEPAGAGRSDVGPEERAAADLQRLLDRRRRHRRRSSTSTTAGPRTTTSSTRAASRSRGAIVIARYGGSWRGIKPKIAAEHGAIGCLIYSDPRDDGYFADAVFPDGPMRNKDGVQRGSVHGHAACTPAIR